MKKTFVSFVFLALVVVVFLAFIEVQCNGNMSFFEACLQAISDYGTVYVTSAALYYAMKEYGQHKAEQKTALLCDYLHRYVDDPNVAKVTKYILDYGKTNDKGEIVSLKKWKPSLNTPSIYEKEIFMRLFEEIQIHLDKELLDKETVYDELAYYALVFDDINEFHEDITDYDDEEIWENYHKFIKGMKELRSQDKDKNNVKENKKENDSLRTASDKLCSVCYNQTLILFAAFGFFLFGDNVKNGAELLEKITVSTGSVYTATAACLTVISLFIIFLLHFVRYGCEFAAICLKNKGRFHKDSCFWFTIICILFYAVSVCFFIYVLARVLIVEGGGVGRYFDAIAAIVAYVVVTIVFIIYCFMIPRITKIIS